MFTLRSSVAGCECKASQCLEKRVLGIAFWRMHVPVKVARNSNATVVTCSNSARLAVDQTVRSLCSRAVEAFEEALRDLIEKTLTACGGMDIR